MVTEAKSLVTGEDRFKVLSEVWAGRWKRGRDIVVNVKDAGNGPAVDVREVVTRDAYNDNAFRIRAGRKAGATLKQREPYMGPTKVGFWLSPEMGLEVGEAIISASLKALELRGDDDHRARP